MTGRGRLGRLSLSLVLVGTVAAVLGFEWNDTHVFHPDWHPHARFHLVQMIGTVTALSGLGLWLIWRRSSEPRVGATVATVAAIAFWGGEFYALALPGTSPAFDLEDPNTIVLPGGITVYGNLLFAGAMIVLSVVGYWLFLAEPLKTGRHSQSP